jgi:nicotinamidase-related amidase
MSDNHTRAKRSEKGLLTPDNCVVAFIDLQPQMLFGVANFDRQMIINNNVALAKTARVFDIHAVTWFEAEPPWGSPSLLEKLV